jgi:ABC-type transport system involved in multi-copper enzyme maturation permease subunit
MITLNLLRAEWLKTRKRLINRVMLAIIPAFLCLVMIMVMIQTAVNPGEALGDGILRDAQKLVPYPNNLRLADSTLAEFGFLIVIVFVATSVGSEYGYETWKAIVPRYGHRASFLLTKWIVGLATLLLLVVTIFGIVLPLGWIGATVLGISADTTTTLAPIAYIKSIAVTLLSFVFIGTLTLLATVVARSAVAGVVSGILVTILMTLLKDLLPGIYESTPLLARGLAWLLPMSHFSNLHYQWAWAEPAGETETTMALIIGHPVPSALSLLIGLGYIVIMLGVSVAIFNRRDMAGE